MEKGELKALIEAILLVSPRPITVERLRKIVEVERRVLLDALDELIEEYRCGGRGFYIEEVAGGYQFRTRERFTPWLKRLEGLRPPSLSRAALETLAIIAYRQPVTRAEIEEIRGVEVGGILRNLLQRRLIKVLGRKDIPGRPIVYGTTREFLELFGLKDLSALPVLEEEGP